MSMFTVLNLKCTKFKCVKLFFAKYLKTILIKSPKWGMSNNLSSTQDHTWGEPKHEPFVTSEMRIIIYFFIIHLKRSQIKIVGTSI